MSTTSSDIPLTTSSPLHSTPAHRHLTYLTVEAGEVGEASADDGGDEDLLVEEVPHRHLHPKGLEDHVGDPVGQPEGHREGSQHQGEGSEEPFVVVLLRRLAVDVRAVGRDGRRGIRATSRYEYAESLEGVEKWESVPLESVRCCNDHVWSQ